MTVFSKVVYVLSILISYLNALRITDVKTNSFKLHPASVTIIDVAFQMHCLLQMCTPSHSNYTSFPQLLWT